jgi:hypothetical protein
MKVEVLMCNILGHKSYFKAGAPKLSFCRTPVILEHDQGVLPLKSSNGSLFPVY